MKKRIDRIEDFCTEPYLPTACLTVQVGDTHGKRPLFVWSCERGFKINAQLLTRNKPWPQEGTEVFGIALFAEGEKELTAIAKALRFTAKAVEELTNTKTEGELPEVSL